MEESDYSANRKTFWEFPSFGVFLFLDFYPKPTVLRVAPPGLLAWRMTGKF